MRLILITLGLILAVAGPSGAAETQIAILTATPSGAWYPLGTTLSSIYTKAIPGANVTVQATHGSVENLRLLEAGDGELGFTLGSSLALAWAGDKEAGFNAPLRKLRVIARIYPNFLEIGASEKSGIKTLADLKGKRASIGPKGSGTAVDAIAIFKAAGFTPDDLANFAPGPWAPSFGRVEKGELDAAMIEGGLDMELVRHLLASGQAQLVPIPPEIVAKVGSQGYVAGVIPARTFDGQPNDVPTTAVMNFLVTREGSATMPSI